MQGHPSTHPNFSNPGSVQRRAAAQLADHGIRVFPLRSGDKEPRRGSRGFYDASANPETVAGWWGRYPESNIGIPTGPGNGLLILDVDPKHGGNESLAELEAEIGPIPETTRVRTGGGGEHIYFRYPAGERVRSNAGKLGPGLDVRAESGYVVAAGSHTTGPYAYTKRAGRADVPAALLDRLREPHSTTERGVEKSGESHTEQGVAVGIDGPPIPSGERNVRLTQVAGKLRARGMESGELRETLHKINGRRCSPPLETSEVERIARNAARWSAGSARSLDAGSRAGLEDRRRGVIEHPELFKGMGGRGARDLYIVLIELAETFGEAIHGGIRVSASYRQAALRAGMGKSSAQRAANRLRMAGLITKDDDTRSREESGAFVLAPRANWDTLPAGLDNVPNRGGGVPGCAPPFTAPRLRWGAPQFEGRERVGTIARLGKTAGAILDSLEAAGGSLTIAGIAAALGLSRERDVKRRDGPLSRLEGAEIVLRSGDTVSLAPDWLDALESERERAGETAATRRDEARYDRESRAYRRVLNEETRPAPEPAAYYAPRIVISESLSLPDPEPDGYIEDLEILEPVPDETPADPGLAERVAAYFSDPPDWLLYQMSVHISNGTERLIRPTAGSVAYLLGIDPAETLPAVEREMALWI